MSAEGGAVYLDSSALVKLVVREAESDALSYHLQGRSQWLSCALVRVEVVRAVRGHGQPAVSRARRLLERIGLLRLDDALLDAAAALQGVSLRGLDAIHIAAARSLGDDLAELITYDLRMTRTAEEAGLSIAAPA